MTMQGIDPASREDKRDDGAATNTAQEFRDPRGIVVGERHRKEYGDLAALARSINARGGLIHPIAATPQNELIAGERRLRAWQLPECRFHDRPIPVTVIDIDSIVAGESDENDPELRKAFTPSEAVAIARALRPRVEAEAKERQRQHGGTAPGRKASEHCAQVAPSVAAEKGRTAARIAKATGKGARTLEKAAAIVEAAEADPDRFGPLVEAMDRTGRVNGPYKRLRNIVAADRDQKGTAGPADERPLSRRHYRPALGERAGRERKGSRRPRLLPLSNHDARTDRGAPGALDPAR